MWSASKPPSGPHQAHLQPIKDYLLHDSHLRPVWAVPGELGGPGELLQDLLDILREEAEGPAEGAGLCHLGSPEPGSPAASPCCSPDDYNTLEDILGIIEREMPPAETTSAALPDNTSGELYGLKSNLSSHTEVETTNVTAVQNTTDTDRRSTATGTADGSSPRLSTTSLNPQSLYFPYMESLQKTSTPVLTSNAGLARLLPPQTLKRRLDHQYHLNHEETEVLPGQMGLTQSQVAYLLQEKILQENRQNEKWADAQTHGFVVQDAPYRRMMAHGSPRLQWNHKPYLLCEPLPKILIRAPPSAFIGGPRQDSNVLQVYRYYSAAGPLGMNLTT